MSSKKINPVKQTVTAAIAQGSALNVKEIRTLRAQSNKAVTLFKSLFWTGIVIFNLVLWAPLPVVLNKTVLYVVAFIVLIVALIVSILGLRKNQETVELLKVCSETPKKKTASEAGRRYIDQVKKQERPFLNVEFELLEGSKWSAGQAQGKS